MSYSHDDQETADKSRAGQPRSFSPEFGTKSLTRKGSDTSKDVTIVAMEGTTVNASGYKDQMRRQYGLLAICGLALTIDNAWVAFGGSLSVAVLNGGPPGILYELIVACIYYGFVAASIAELASAIPSSGGVYHWASITPGPKTDFSAGWIFDLASIVYIPANVVVQMYAVFHPDFEIKPWHSYVAFVLITWLCAAFVIFCNRLIPALQHAGLFLIIAGGLVTIIVVAAVPTHHATNAFVWKDFSNLTGWSDGVAFLTGVLNGAFVVGTVDAVTHVAEEVPTPTVDLPKAIFAQVGLGFVTAFVYAIAIMYSIDDLEAVTSSSGSFPLAEVYAQATGTAGGTFGLLFILFLSIIICAIGTLLMVGRLFWTLARDNATPFPSFFSSVNEELSCPVPATILCAVLCTALGAIQLGSKTAFTDLVGSFIILTSVSYFMAIFPNLLTKRRNVTPGPFHMGRFGFAINGIACTLIIFFNLFFCFPYAYPVDPISVMNCELSILGSSSSFCFVLIILIGNSVLFVGVIMLTAFWWFVHGRRNYSGPKLAMLHLEGQS
nr:choline transport protein [Quercus suber]